MYFGLHIKCPIFVSDFNWIGFFPRESPPPLPNIEIHRNICSGNYDHGDGRTDRQTEREEDVKNLMGAYSECMNVPETVAAVIKVIIIIIIIIIIITIITCYSW